MCLNFLHKFINTKNSEENMGQMDNEIFKSSSWDYLLLQKTVSL
jgi:hypothetical protein